MRTVKITFDAASGTLKLAGPLGVHQAASAQRQWRGLTRKGAAITAFDLADVTLLDTVGAMVVADWAGGLPVHTSNARQQSLLAMMAGLERAVPHSPPVAASWRQQVAALGKWSQFLRGETRELLTFTGKALAVLIRACARPERLRFPAIAHAIEQVGVRALPIIGLIAFLISIVLAYQGVAQLRPYGGEQFTVDLVALSIFREMGVLLTAIMVAGRSGSAFTAEIGVMKAREEVDALQVMGFDPFDMLVVPRLLAILLALPLLTFFADMTGLLGGFIISHALIDITPERYIERVHFAVGGGDLFVGLIKAPVFALVIGVVGCMHGLKVGGSAESIGRETTASVVKSIFLVLVLDAVFSIFFEQVGL